MKTKNIPAKAFALCLNIFHPPNVTVVRKQAIPHIFRPSKSNQVRLRRH
ncbi:hypothetical protein P879_06212 [Paragonimus westermani]|uniref:Uncharacterized protein n=1 Tax=Paragonimus westermani TaxID=34504 RepID=A0A8T0DWS3_9TREM|nr:hypothetical protein P879_06212 [Paragonimus westermani]